MAVRTLWGLVVVATAACSSGNPVGNGVTCGPGTTQIGDVCELPDAGRSDAAIDAAVDAPRDTGAEIDAPADAGSGGASQATTIGLDPAHDNVQPMDTVASPLTPLWTATLTGPVPYVPVSYPLVANGRVFVTADTATDGTPPSVRALDLHTGATVWGPIALANRATLAYDGGRVFVLDERGALMALDAATGTQAWAIQVQPQPFYNAPPLASGGVLYIDGTGNSGTLVAISEQTGAVLWTVDVGGTMGCAALGNGLLYVDDPCNFEAFDPANGTLVWNHFFQCSGGGGWAPSVHGGRVWDRNSPMGNLIFEATADVPVGTFGTTAMPAFDGGVAFYTTSYGVIAVDLATSKLRWSFAGDGQLCTSPVIARAGGQVLIGSQSGKVYELDEATGAQRSMHDIGQQLACSDETHSIAVAEGHLLVPTMTTLVVF